MSDSQFSFVIGILFGSFLGLGFSFFFSVRPLQQEAINRGYASFTISTTTHQSTSEFTWK